MERDAKISIERNCDLDGEFMEDHVSYTTSAFIRRAREYMFVSVLPSGPEYMFVSVLCGVFSWRDGYRCRVKSVSFRKVFFKVMSSFIYKIQTLPRCSSDNSALHCVFTVACYVSGFRLDEGSHFFFLSKSKNWSRFVLK